MRKNILSLILVGILAFSNLHFAYAVEDDVPVPERLTVGETKVDKSKYQNIYDLLKYLGLVDENLDDIDMKKNPKRGYVAKLAARIVNENIIEVSESPYSDVSLSHEYVHGIAAAKRYNITGENEKFNPDRNVTYGDIASWFVKAIKIDMLKPQNVSDFDFASDMGFFDGVDASKEKNPTYEELFAVVENVLNTEIADVSITSENTYLSQNEDETYLSKRNIYLQKGIVTAVGYASFDNDELLEENEIEINKQKFITNAGYDGSLFAKAVYAYVNTEDDMNIAITVWEDKKNNNCNETENVNEAEFYTDRIVFEDKTKVKVDDFTNVFVNGIYNSLYKDVYKDKILTEADLIRTIDNNGDNVADVILVYNYQNYVVNSVSSISKTVSFMYGEETLKLEDENVKAKITLKGLPISISDLQQNDVLTVIKSIRRNGEKTYQIDVSRNMVTGIITQIDKSNGKTSYRINDELYTISKEYEKFLETDTSEEKPALNKAGNFYINTRGEVVAAKITGEYLYGILRKAISDEETERYQLKMYTTNGSFERITLAEKVNFYSEDMLEGRKIEDDLVYKHITDGSGGTLQTVVAYKIKNDVISELALPVDRTGYNPGSIDYPLTKDYVCGTNTQNTGEASRIYMNLLAAKFYIKNTRTITIPDEEEYKDDEKQYKVTLTVSSNNVYADKTADTSPGLDAVVTLYNADKFHIPAFATIEKKVTGDSAAMNVRTASVMITAVEQTLNSDNESVIKISYNSAGSTVSKIISTEAEKVENKTGEKWFGTEGDLSGLKKGDIIQFDTNAVGEISAVRLLFRCSNKGDFRIQSGTDETVSAPQKTFAVMPKFCVVYGKLVDRKGNILIVNVSDSGTDEKYQYIYNVANTFRANTYTVVDEQMMKCYNATLNELQPGDEVLLIREYSTVADVYMFR